MAVAVESKTEAREVIPGAIQELVALEQREKIHMSLSDRLADLVTSFSGSMTFVWLNAIAFVTWIGVHVLGVADFDPFPYGLLTMIVSLEAIGLSIFVLISENRQAALADKRAKLNLQMNVISEREVTKLIEMVAHIEQRLGITNGYDPEVREMRRPTHIRDLADKMEEYENAIDEESAKGPSSAADTEA